MAIASIGAALLIAIALLTGDGRADAAPAAASSADAPRATEAERASRARLERALGPQAVLDIDDETGTPRVIARLDGTLTGPRPGTPREIAERYLRSHLTELGMTEADLAGLRLEESSTGAGGLRTFGWRRHIDGVPAIDGGVRITVTDDDRVLSVLGSAPAPRVETAVPRLSAADALRNVMADVDVRKPVEIDARARGPLRRTRFAGDDRAQLAFFTERGSARIAWRVSYSATPDEWYDAIVDAHTGAVLRKVNLVKRAVPATVWEQYPGAPRGGTAATVDLAPWLDSSTKLSGPLAHVFADVDDDDVADPDEEIVPGSYAFKDFTPGFDSSTPDNTTGGCSAAARCGWNSGVAGSWSANRSQSAVQAFYFVNRFARHLKAAPIGFDADDGSFEGATRLRVHTHDGAATAGGMTDGAHSNNADMATPQGAAPRMQLYLYKRRPETPGSRDINAADDAGLVYHEYAHGLSTRLVENASGPWALYTNQGAALGEGWSDFYAMDFLVGQFPADDSAAPGEVDIATYRASVAGLQRTQGLDCTVGIVDARCPGHGDAGPGGYTLGDFDRIDSRNLHSMLEAHYNGEIWAETLWDIRRSLGTQVTRAIVTQGMRLGPPGTPTFLDMRDAIILADRGIYGAGHHADELWRVFAARGMGVNATTEGAQDFTLTEDFTRPASVPPPPPPPPPDPDPDPDPDPVPDPGPDPDPDPVPDPGPDPDPDPDPGPDPEPGPDPDPGQHPDPGPDPDPNPDSGPDPSPGPDPDPNPDPAPGPGSGSGPGDQPGDQDPSPGTSGGDPFDRPGGRGRGDTGRAGGPPNAVIRSARAGMRIRITLVCASACKGTARIQLDRRAARRASIARGTRARAPLALRAAGRRTFTVALPRAARSAARRASLRTLRVTVRVAVTDADGQQLIAKRTLRVAR